MTARTVRIIILFILMDFKAAKDGKSNEIAMNDVWCSGIPILNTFESKYYP